MHYKTKVYGVETDKVVIETEGKHPFEIKAQDAIVKLWFSDGTVLGLKYSTRSKIWANLWKIRVLNRGTKEWAFRQIERPTLLHYSDEYTLDAELVNYCVTPRTYYTGDDME
jgi:hypothetical protein